jgi:hypothetical protein
VNEGWRESFVSLWKSLLYEKGAMRFLRILIALLFILSIVWSMYLYRQIAILSAVTPVEAPEIKLKKEEGDNYANTVEELERITMVRSKKGELAHVASTLERYPFEAPVLTSYQPSYSNVPSEYEKSYPLQAELYLPPYMEVRAVMLLDGKAMALMDIEGEGIALIVYPGYEFANGRGRIVSISLDKVVVLWAGTSMELGIDAL